jgi:hypothetical protein
MTNYDEFKKRDKSEKVTVLHVEPVKQLIRWTDQGCKRFNKDITTPYTKTNSILIGMVRNETELLNYHNFNFLEDDQSNPFLTDDDQFFLMEI